MSQRYERQIIINKVGIEGQERLQTALVAVIGVGGLGSPILTYLTAAGVGRLTLIDYDCVEISNLNRQFLHGTDDIGLAKVTSARKKLEALNHEVKINPLAVKLTKENAKELLIGHDLVIGALDSLEARFIVNEACVGLGIPYLDGGVKEFGGSVIFTDPPNTPCFNCVFPKKEKTQEKAKGKEIIGVMGVTPGVIGTIQADIALIHLLGLPNPIINKLLIYDGLRMSMDLIDIVVDEQCDIC